MTTAILYVGDAPTLLTAKVKNRAGIAARPYAPLVWKEDVVGCVELTVADDGLSAIANPIGVGTTRINVFEPIAEIVKAAPAAVHPGGSAPPPATAKDALTPEQLAALGHENARRAALGIPPLNVADPKEIPPLPKSVYEGGGWAYTSYVLEVRPANGHELTLNVGSPGVGVPAVWPVPKVAKAA